MIVVHHSVGGTRECPEITFDVIGSTGNIYEVVIRKEPVCNCPDGLKGNQCKHICYSEFPASLVHLYNGGSNIAIRCILTDRLSSAIPCPQSAFPSPVSTRFPVLGKWQSCSHVRDSGMIGSTNSTGTP